ncbi:hypothetical protein KGM_201393 [Danaus plexippus plexippus]|uniref:Uncharacterized protein n=1 Tax=Danaus plexippus plexippus TaxID=278856 RepID=A0A212FHI5_DANPL|nr:hypothetical protein KGM_201393 [Danaus plexippus plexippus]
MESLWFGGVGPHARSRPRLCDWQTRQNTVTVACVAIDPRSFNHSPAVATAIATKCSPHLESFLYKSVDIFLT